jgi:hypothetical protein
VRMNVDFPAKTRSSEFDVDPFEIGCEALQAWNAAALSHLQNKWRISSERVEVSTMPGRKLSTVIAMGLARPEAAAGGK